MDQKSCFVVMPIRKAGTPEHAHFRAIFNHIRPTIEAGGYSVIRADDVQKSGAITKDIISQLAQSDLVIADLTDLNPNVFYELGVRHALRGNGTLMIIDEKRTTEIPFDLGAYRVIKFSGDLIGMETLNSTLALFLKESADSKGSRDNPVHDWFPTLPTNVLDSASQSSSASLHRTIRELENRIEQYEKAYGSKLGQSSRDDSPLSLVISAISDAQDGLLPVNVLDDARNAFESRDVIGLLQKLRTVIERNIRLPASAFIALVRYAVVLDLDGVVRALFSQALQFYPSDSNLKHSYLAHLAHSEAPADRERARREIMAEVGLTLSEVGVTVVDPTSLRRNLDLFGLLLDAHHRDDLDADALRITQRALEMFPSSTKVLRSHARALEAQGRTEEAMTAYRAAVLAPDVDDTSAVWLGNTLHNREQHVAAAEVYALACVLDPKDAHNFSHLAQELAICVAERHRATDSPDSRSLPGDITDEQILALAHCVASCPNVDAEVSQRLRSALDSLELSIPHFETPLARSERIQIVQPVYDALRSELTTSVSTGHVEKDAVH